MTTETAKPQTGPTIKPGEERLYTAPYGPATVEVRVRAVPGSRKARNGRHVLDESTLVLWFTVALRLPGKDGWVLEDDGIGRGSLSLQWRAFPNGEQGWSEHYRMLGQSLHRWQGLAQRLGVVDLARKALQEAGALEAFRTLLAEG